RVTEARLVGTDPSAVIAGLDPAIHPTSKDFLRTRCMRGSSSRMTQTGFNLIGRRSDELAALHVAPLSRQLHQQLLRNAYDVVLTVIWARRSLLVRASPID